MEQARYWMWAKRKQCLNSSGDSWEEQAFAEDSSGPLGGCIWPPRSYSCSFCRREFRSAQALGGHMNVHRRDRARLKQSPTPPHTEIDLHHQNSIPPCTSLRASGSQYPSTQVCTSFYNPNPNTNTPIVVASSPSPSRVSGPSTTQGNHSEQTLISSSYSSSSSVILQQHQNHTKGLLPFSPPPSWSDSTAVRVLSVPDSKEIEGVKNLLVHQSQPDGSGGEENCKYPTQKLEQLGGETHRYMRGQKISGATDVRLFSHHDDVVQEEEEVEASFIRKRRRSDDESSLPFFLFNSSSVDRHHHLQSEVLGVGTNSMEDLDLELRLGDGPKVK